MIPNSVPVYLASAPCDMRKGVNGLRALVRGASLDPLAEAVFVFYSRRRNISKALWFGGNGFVVYYKRLEKGTFHIPAFDRDKAHFTMTVQELDMLLAGVELSSVQRRPHWRPPGRSE